MKPMEIENRSMEIIEAELKAPLPAELAPIIKRVIHATADFSFAEAMRFTQGVVPLMRGMLAQGVTLVTDTNMALAGINKAALHRLNADAFCFMADEAVALEARERGETRAVVAMEKALRLPGQKLLICGNAPTFLWPLLEQAVHDDIAVIGVPVGFVNVVETKERLWASGLPCIVAMGRRGGSNVAAAIVNALMYGIEGARE